MSLQDLIAFDSAALLASGDFDEGIIVTFADGTTRTIRGWVSRQPPQPYQGVPAPLMEVRIPISATAGVTVAEFDPGGMTLTLPFVAGGTPEPFNVFVPNDGRPFICDGVIRVNLR